MREVVVAFGLTAGSRFQQDTIPPVWQGSHTHDISLQSRSRLSGRDAVAPFGDAAFAAGASHNTTARAAQTVQSVA
jgi:hypothetical protein